MHVFLEWWEPCGKQSFLSKGGNFSRKTLEEAVGTGYEQPPEGGLALLREQGLLQGAPRDPQNDP